MTDEKGTTELFGEGLPGTGGDFVDGNDTEGHRLSSASEAPDLPGARPQQDGSTDQDVEGHRLSSVLGEDTGVPQARRIPDDESQDVEGHLYTGGPTTKGEFVKRAPSDNPHGER